MLWYLLRTWPGREEMLVKEIQKTVPSYLYQEVFVIYNERIWRRQGESIIHAEPLFPGCVFLTCEKTDPFLCIYSGSRLCQPCLLPESFPHIH
ncbi:hypothetical protein DW974_17200 [Lachnospiraceae bacterium AM48-27BH]|nr:hypothetical protein DW974_17200 [Lachnospiraceae bacterium AM48-27BH]